jgi:hypothetical protein
MEVWVAELTCKGSASPLVEQKFCRPLDGSN